MPNDMRDRLIDLLDKSFLESDSNYGTPSINQVADYLLENGVFVLPCKVGTELFLSDYINGHHRLKEYKFCGNRIAIVIECWEFQRTCTRWLDDFGKTIFLTKEEAENALRGNGNEKL